MEHLRRSDMSAEELAELMAKDAEDLHRFVGGSRTALARVALLEVLKDLVPLVPLLLAAHEDLSRSSDERTHLGELLDTLRVKPV